MPNIEQYDAKGEITPSDKGIEAELVVGRRIGQFGHQIGESIRGIGDVVEEHEGRMEISNGAASGAVMEAGYQQQWHDYVAAHPGDPHLARGFLQDVVLPNEEKWRGAFRTDKGQNYALSSSDQRITRLFNQLTGEQLQIEADHAENNIKTVGVASEIATQNDPYGADQRLQDNDHAVDQIASTIQNPAGADKFATDMKRIQGGNIVMSQLNTLAARARQEISQTGDPTKSKSYQDLTALVEGKHNFDRLDDTQLTEIIGRDGAPGLLEKVARDGRSEFTVNNGAQRKATEDQTDAAIGRIRASLLPDANGNPPDPKAAAQALRDLSGLLTSKDPVVAARASHEAESIQGVIRTQAEDRLTGKFTQDDPGAVARLNQGIATMGKADIDQMYIARQISDKTHEKYTQLWDALHNNEQLRQTREQLSTFLQHTIGPQLTHGDVSFDPNNPTSQSLFSGGGADPNGRSAFGFAYNQVMAQYDWMTIHGFSPTDAYKQITDPAAISKAMPTWQAYAKNGFDWALQHQANYGVGADVSRPATPAAAPTLSPAGANAVARARANPIKPGEDPSAYLKRIGAD